MTDLVVTVPKDFWPDWIAEGDAVGEAETGTEWSFYVGARKPSIRHGERLYIVACGRLRGYAPVTRVALARPGQWAICRQGGAVACTVDQEIRGFQGFRQPWWRRLDEMPFAGWQIVGVPLPMLDYFLPRLAASWDDKQDLAADLGVRDGTGCTRSPSPGPGNRAGFLDQRRRRLAAHGGARPGSE